MTKIGKLTKYFVMLSAPVIVAAPLLVLTSCSSSDENDSSSNNNESNNANSSSSNGDVKGEIAFGEKTLVGTYDVPAFEQEYRGIDVLENVFKENSGYDLALTYENTKKPIIYSAKTNIQNISITTSTIKRGDGETIHKDYSIRNIYLELDFWYENNKWNYYNSQEYFNNEFTKNIVELDESDDRYDRVDHNYILLPLKDQVGSIEGQEDPYSDHVDIIFGGQMFLGFGFDYNKLSFTFNSYQTNLQYDFSVNLWKENINKENSNILAYKTFDYAESNLVENIQIQSGSKIDISIKK